MSQMKPQISNNKNMNEFFRNNIVSQVVEIYGGWLKEEQAQKILVMIRKHAKYIAEKEGLKKGYIIYPVLEKADEERDFYGYAKENIGLVKLTKYYALVPFLPRAVMEDELQELQDILKHVKEETKKLLDSCKFMGMNVFTLLGVDYYDVGDLRVEYVIVYDIENDKFMIGYLVTPIVYYIDRFGIICNSQLRWLLEDNTCGYLYIKH